MEIPVEIAAPSNGSEGKTTPVQNRIEIQGGGYEYTKINKIIQINDLIYFSGKGIGENCKRYLFLYASVIENITELLGLHRTIILPVKKEKVTCLKGLTKGEIGILNKEFPRLLFFPLLREIKKKPIQEGNLEELYQFPIGKKVGIDILDKKRSELFSESPLTSEIKEKIKDVVINRFITGKIFWRKDREWYNYYRGLLTRGFELEEIEYKALKNIIEVHSRFENPPKRGMTNGKEVITHGCRRTIQTVFNVLDENLLSKNTERIDVKTPKKTKPIVKKPVISEEITTDLRRNIFQGEGFPQEFYNDDNFFQLILSKAKIFAGK